jgi:hypothetical protein
MPLIVYIRFLFSSAVFTFDCGLIGSLKLSEDRATRHWGSKMNAPEFGHEGLPHFFTAQFE